MARNRKKVTTVYKDLFGNKVIETEWVRAGSGCGGVVIFLIFIYMCFLFGGCG